MTELTDKGMPRPTHGKLPVPWVVASSDFKKMEEGRRQAVIEEKLCQVCGEEHKRSGWAYVFVKANEEPPEPRDEILVQCMDEAMLHKECADLALEHCPELKQLRHGDMLIIYRTLAININSYEIEGELHLAVPLRLCQRVVV